MRSSLKFAGLAFQMLAIIGVMTYVGVEIDRYYRHTTLWATAFFSLAGVGIAFYQVFSDLQKR